MFVAGVPPLLFVTQIVKLTFEPMDGDGLSAVMFTPKSVSGYTSRVAINSSELPSISAT